MAAMTRARTTSARERERIWHSRDRFWRPEDLSTSGSTTLHLLRAWFRPVTWSDFAAASTGGAAIRPSGCPPNWVSRSRVGARPGRGSSQLVRGELVAPADAWALLRDLLSSGAVRPNDSPSRRAQSLGPPGRAYVNSYTTMAAGTSLIRCQAARLLRA